MTKTSFTVRSNDIVSETINGELLKKGTELKFSSEIQWYKVHDGENGDVISGITKM